MVNKEDKILKEKIKCYTKDVISLLKVLGFNDIKDCNGLKYNEIRIAANGLNMNGEYQFYLRVSIRYLDNMYYLFLLDYNCDLGNDSAIYQFLAILNTLFCFGNINMFDIAVTQSTLSLLINNPVINNYLCSVGFMYCESREFSPVYSKKFL